MGDTNLRDPTVSACIIGSKGRSFESKVPFKILPFEFFKCIFRPLAKFSSYLMNVTTICELSLLFI